MEARNLGELGHDLQQLISRLMANQNLMKLLIDTTKDPLSRADLTDEEIRTKIYNKQILPIPYLRAEQREDATSIVSLRVARGTLTPQNKEFRNIFIQFEIFVPTTQWIIKNENFRPFAIMSEISKSINGKKINGLGKVEGGDFDLNFMTEEMSCYTLDYWITEYE